MPIIRTRAAKGALLESFEADNNMKRGVSSKSAAYTAELSDNRDTLVVTGTTTITLPEASSILSASETGDYRVTIVNVGSDDVTVTAVGGNTILGETSLTLAAREAVTLVAVSGGYVVTGRGEGGNAATLDGRHASDFAASGHNHSGTYAPLTRTLTAGNGLTGGGDLSANRTLTLGTPSSITDSSTNSVTSTSHTHAFNLANGSLGAEKFQTGTAERDWILARLASTTAGSVGSYALLSSTGTATDYSIGDTIAGSNLRPFGFYNGNAIVAGGDAMPGTWRFMGHGGNPDSGSALRATLFMRIS